MANDQVKSCGRDTLLRDLCDEPEFVARLLNTFIRETTTDLEGLVSAFSSRDSARVAGLAHRVKGAAATVRAESIREEAARIEYLARQGRLQEAHTCMAGITAELDRFCGSVSDLLQLP